MRESSASTPWDQAFRDEAGSTWTALRRGLSDLKKVPETCFVPDPLRVINWQVHTWIAMFPCVDTFVYQRVYMPQAPGDDESIHVVVHYR